MPSARVRDGNGDTDELEEELSDREGVDNLRPAKKRKTTEGEVASFLGTEAGASFLSKYLQQQREFELFQQFKSLTDPQRAALLTPSPVHSSYRLPPTSPIPFPTYKLPG